jgi:hypothetical protein
MHGDGASRDGSGGWGLHAEEQARPRSAVGHGSSRETNGERISSFVFQCSPSKVFLAQVRVLLSVVLVLTHHCFG